VEFFGSVDRVFQASLTELEASGLPVQSAKALATGRSVDLANEEIARTAAAGAHLVAFDDPAYPARLKQIYDPPLVLYVRGNPAVLSMPALPSWARATQLLAAPACPSVCRATWPREAW
jgi:DNA processing protein